MDAIGSALAHRAVKSASSTRDALCFFREKNGEILIFGIVDDARHARRNQNRVA
jgi:hypothetical protein